MQFNPDLTLNEVVLQWPDAVTVLTRYGMDTCCGGALPLREAAARHGVDLEVLLQELEMKAPAPR
jgi:iron-sulfur cluster repair protein YtfE (RIC family)